MGFVYNNVSEAMCKTFLEMNGWFVQTNLFTDLLTAPKGQELYRHEADLVAFKIPGTDTCPDVQFSTPDPYASPS